MWITFYKFILFIKNYPLLLYQKVKRFKFLSIMKLLVYNDGEILNLTVKELKQLKLNVIVNKTNGYSHDYSMVVKYHKKYIRNVGGKKTLWTTKKAIGKLPNSSTVSST